MKAAIWDCMASRLGDEAAATTCLKAKQVQLQQQGRLQRQWQLQQPWQVRMLWQQTEMAAVPMV